MPNLRGTSSIGRGWEGCSNGHGRSVKEGWIGGVAVLVGSSTFDKQSSGEDIAGDVCGQAF